MKPITTLTKLSTPKFENGAKLVNKRSGAQAWIVESWESSRPQTDFKPEVCIRIYNRKTRKFIYEWESDFTKHWEPGTWKWEYEQ